MLICSQLNFELGMGCPLRGLVCVNHLVEDTRATGEFVNKLYELFLWQTSSLIAKFISLLLYKAIWFGSRYFGESSMKRGQRW